MLFGIRSIFYALHLFVYSPRRVIFQFSGVAMNEFAIVFCIECWRQYEWRVRYRMPYFCLLARLLSISVGGMAMMLYAHRVCIIRSPSSLRRDYCYRAKMFTRRISGKSINNLLFMYFILAISRTIFILFCPLDSPFRSQQSNTKCIR